LLTGLITGLLLAGLRRFAALVLPILRAAAWSLFSGVQHVRK
jgi:hypothetical protein